MYIVALFMRLEISSSKRSTEVCEPALYVEVSVH
jgi:hypothetical protein